MAVAVAVAVGFFMENSFQEVFGIIAFCIV